MRATIRNRRCNHNHNHNHNYNYLTTTHAHTDTLHGSVLSVLAPGRHFCKALAFTWRAVSGANARFLRQYGVVNYGAVAFASLNLKMTNQHSKWLKSLAHEPFPLTTL
jgi:hypothetical protein